MSASVSKLLNDRLLTGSKSDRAIANYMLAQIRTLPFETAASLAAKVNVSEATVGRFCRNLGFKSFKDLKQSLIPDFADSPWLVGDRLRDLREKTRSGEDQLTRALELEMAAVVAVYEIAQQHDFKRVVKRLASQTTVFAAGFQTERGMAQVFANQLQYIRSGVHLVDLAAGNFAEVLAEPPGEACLVIFEARRFSRLALILAQEAQEAGIPVTLVTDAFCDWGHGVADEIFVVPTEFNLFWESNAQMASLANLLVNGVFIEMGADVEGRMNRIAALYGRFIGHVGGSLSDLAPKSRRQKVATARADRSPKGAG